MKLVAVTSCPTGIAHSQMAAENLEQTAARLGHEIHVEIQGAMGAENELSAPQIAAADAAIIAADTAVSPDRFEDLPLVKAPVKDAVNDPEGLIRRAEAAAEGGTVAGDGESNAATADTRSEGPDAAERAEPERVGGDPRKGLFARLRRLLS
ncbi:PTS fructose transporter subunit IIB [Halomarina halobia]|uniref:PTS fructose transporter subunit IIB n=1 Tax=Halomarina halobia TaxID=3033386 RepID=A0ABD6AAG4_9EURY|nr:fructose PTS transporter subunit IIB [Halomarina sp. PSR21]